MQTSCFSPKCLWASLHRATSIGAALRITTYGRAAHDDKKVLFSKGTIYKTLESPQVVKLRKLSRKERDEGEHSFAEGQKFKKRFEKAADLKEK